MTVSHPHAWNPLFFPCPLSGVPCSCCRMFAAFHSALHSLLPWARGPCSSSWHIPPGFPLAPSRSHWLCCRIWCRRHSGQLWVESSPEVLRVYPAFLHRCLEIVIYQGLGHSSEVVETVDVPLQKTLEVTPGKALT
ncbi:hypothetical protein [Aminobacterium colombiense]